LLSGFFVYEVENAKGSNGQTDAKAL